MNARSLLIAASVVLVFGAQPAHAWPADLSQSIARDALKLIPRSLAELFRAHEKEIFGEASTASSPALPLVYADLAKGKFGESTTDALAKEMADRVKDLHGADFRAAVIALGATYRLVVDLSDPGVSEGLGFDAKGRAIRREFYLYVAAHRDKIPLVIVQPDAMRMKLEAVPSYLSAVVAKTSSQATLLREEGVEGGRVTPYTQIDFRSPVFAVASTSYSRSVSAVAATWIAIWRSAGGDMNRQKVPQLISPKPSAFSQE
ncbi:MAG: hypothetical protein ABI672_15390 [Vicinamibacteria bacterium]